MTSNRRESSEQVESALCQAVEQARALSEGEPAGYIPELAEVDVELTSAAVRLVDGRSFRAGDDPHRFTLQSSAKLVVLAGLLEERGPDAVFRVVGTEPSGGSFASVARLETHGPIPANPLVNAGAIALCGLLEGTVAERKRWVLDWAARLYDGPIDIDEAVFSSERATADRNRAIAHYLKYGGVLDGRVDETLDVYFALCSLQAGVHQAAHLPLLLANRGLTTDGRRILSERTVAIVMGLMATCGMYDESGAHLLASGLPAKSGVSGVIVAVSPGRAGIAACSPRVNAKGGSLRAHAILRSLSSMLGWHFALARR